MSSFKKVFCGFINVDKYDYLVEIEVEQGTWYGHIQTVCGSWIQVSLLSLLFIHHQELGLALCSIGCDDGFSA